MTEKFKVTPDLYASHGKRLGNFLLDYVIQVVLGAGIGIVLVLIAELTESYDLYNWLISEDKLSDYIFGIIILLIYYIIIETITGRSIGKYATNTKVVLEDGSKPDFNDIVIRTLCRIIPFDGLSFLGSKAHGWHDSLSKTYVVDIAKFEAKKNAANEIDEIGKLPEEI